MDGLRVRCNRLYTIGAIRMIYLAGNASFFCGAHFLYSELPVGFEPTMFLMCWFTKPVQSAVMRQEHTTFYLLNQTFSQIL